MKFSGKELAPAKGRAQFCKILSTWRNEDSFVTEAYGAKADSGPIFRLQAAQNFTRAPGHGPQILVACPGVFNFRGAFEAQFALHRVS